jgi:hypothetical protein
MPYFKDEAEVEILAKHLKLYQFYKLIFFLPSLRIVTKIAAWVRVCFRVKIVQMVN